MWVCSARHKAALALVRWSFADLAASLVFASFCCACASRHNCRLRSQAKAKPPVTHAAIQRAAATMLEQMQRMLTRAENASSNVQLDEPVLPARFAPPAPAAPAHAAPAAPAPAAAAPPPPPPRNPRCAHRHHRGCHRSRCRISSRPLTFKPSFLRHPGPPGLTGLGFHSVLAFPSDTTADSNTLPSRRRVDRRAGESPGGGWGGRSLPHRPVDNIGPALQGQISSLQDGL